MSRNGSGTYTKVNTFTAGQTITAAGHNQNWDDIASEMTNSVAVDGQSTMTGPLKLPNGSQSAPAATFGSDTDTGIWRSSANSVAIGGGNTIAAEFTPTQVTIKVPFVASATASFEALGTANFVATASFSNLLVASATASFLGTANFAAGFIASATATFAGELIASATATFTTQVNIAGSAAVTLATEGAVHLSSQTASSSSAIEFTTNLGSTYDIHQFHLSGVKPATDDVELRMQVGTGAGPTYLTTGYAYAQLIRTANASNINNDANTTSYFSFTGAAGGGNAVGNASDELINIVVTCYRPAGGDSVMFDWHGSYVSSSGVLITIPGGSGRRSGATSITGIKFYFSSGNIASGSFTHLAYRKA